MFAMKKNIRKTMLNIVAAMGRIAAIKAAGSVSWAGLHQPKEPNELKKQKNHFHFNNCIVVICFSYFFKQRC